MAVAGNVSAHPDASTSPSWHLLMALSATSQPGIRDLFAAEPDRARRFTASAAGLTLDFSRQRVGADALQAADPAAEDVDLRGRIAGMYRGDIANPTEGRQVLHAALRRNGAPYADIVRAERERVLEFAEDVRSGAIRSSSTSRSNWSSTSASAARTWGRPWPWRRCGITVPARRALRSCRTSTVAAWPMCWPPRIPRARCSSCVPRPLPRSRPAPTRRPQGNGWASSWGQARCPRILRGVGQCGSHG